jgi:hypothetical protein
MELVTYHMVFANEIPGSTAVDVGVDLLFVNRSHSLRNYQKANIPIIFAQGGISCIF